MPSQTPSKATGDRGTVIAWIGALLVASIVLRLHGLSYADLDPDEGVYLTIAQTWLRGGLPYQAIWDSHPPALPALLMVSQLLVPDPVIAARIFAALAVWGTATFLFILARRFTNHLSLSLIAPILYIFCISRPNGLAANTEVFNNLGITAAFFMVQSALRTRAYADVRTALAALLLGCCLQIKFNVFPEAASFCLMYLYHRWRNGLSLAGIAGRAILLATLGLMPTVIVAAYFYYNDIFGLYWFANFKANLVYIQISASREDVLRFATSGLAPIIGGLALVAGYVVDRNRRVLCDSTVSNIGSVWIWSLAAVIDVIAPFKFYTHYFYMLYPPMCLLAVVVLRRYSSRLISVILGAVVVIGPAIAVWGLGLLRISHDLDLDPPRIAASLIRENADAGGGLFVYDAHPAIYALSRQASLTPYILGSELHQFSDSSGADGPGEIDRVFGLSPRFVVTPGRAPLTTRQIELDELVARKLSCYALRCAIYRDRAVALNVFERQPALCGDRQRQ